MVYSLVKRVEFNYMYIHDVKRSQALDSWWAAEFESTVLWRVLNFVFKFWSELLIKSVDMTSFAEEISTETVIYSV